MQNDLSNTFEALSRVSQSRQGNEGYELHYCSNCFHVFFFVSDSSYAPKLMIADTIAFVDCIPSFIDAPVSAKLCFEVSVDSLVVLLIESYIHGSLVILQLVFL